MSGVHMVINKFTEAIEMVMFFLFGKRTASSKDS